MVNLISGQHEKFKLLKIKPKFVKNKNKFFFSCQRPESTYFPAVAKFENTCFLATDEEKLSFVLGRKKRMPQIAVCHPRLRLGLQIACDLDHSLFLRRRIKIYYFLYN